MGVRGRSTSWPLPHICSALPRSHVNEGGGRADAECAEQELVLFRSGSQTT